MVARVRIADTEAIAKFCTTKNGIEIRKIVALNYKGGRRTIRLHPESLEQMKAILAERFAHV